MIRYAAISGVTNSPAKDQWAFSTEVDPMAPVNASMKSNWSQRSMTAGCRATNIALKAPMPAAQNVPM